MSKAASRLGRGLSSLLGEGDAHIGRGVQEHVTKQVPIEHLQAGKYQPRRTFDKDELQSLADSIKSQGVLMPLLVREIDRAADENAPEDTSIDTTYYEIIAGERRWRAATQAGLRDVPCIVREISDDEALEIGLVENVQRQDLDAIEEAEGYARLIEEFGHTQTELARLIGKSRSHIANTMRLLKLPETVQTMVRQGRLTAGHARSMITAPDPEKLARRVENEDLSVRDTEKLALFGNQAIVGKKEPFARPLNPHPRHKSPDIRQLENEMSVKLGIRVEIIDHEGKGKLVCHYQDLDQLDDMLSRLGR